MRFLFFLLVLVACVGFGIFYTHPDVREKVRSYQISDGDRERYAAYEQGKALFKATLPYSSTAEFKAWGDDPFETANIVTGTLWLARGTMPNPDGGKAWCIEFDREKNSELGHATGDDASRILSKFDAGDFIPKPPPKVVVKTVEVPVPVPATPAPTPAPGAWMWSKDGRGLLDAPVKSSRGQGYVQPQLQTH